MGEKIYFARSVPTASGLEVRTDYEGCWSSYIVTGNLSGNGGTDVVVMRVSTGSTYGGGEAGILHMENGKWEEYPCRF